MPYLALLLVQVLFALWPIAGAKALMMMSPAAVIGWRTLLGAPMLFGAISLSSAKKPSASDLVRLALLAVLGISANQLMFAEGLLRAGPINAVVLMTMIPVVALSVAVILRRERATFLRAIGISATLGGVLILVRAERFDLSDQKLIGNLLLIGNASVYSIFLVLAKPVVSRIGALAATGWLFLFGALEALPWTAPALASTPWSSLSISVWFWLAFILIGPTIGAYFLNSYALTRLDSSIVAVFAGLQPLIGALAAWALLGQIITARAAIAGLVIIAGVVIASRGDSPTTRRAT